MKKLEELHKIYASNKAVINTDTVEKLMNQYASSLDITISQGCIILNNCEAPLNTIPCKNVIDIVDEAQYIYIILCASIYIICKETGETRIHIRNL